MSRRPVDPASLKALGQLSQSQRVQPEVLSALAALSRNDFGDLRLTTVLIREEGAYGIPLQQSRTGYPLVCGTARVNALAPGDVLVEVNGRLVESVGFDAVMCMLTNVRPLTLRLGHPKGVEQKLKYYGQRWRPFKRKLGVPTGRRRSSVPVALRTVEFGDPGPLGMRLRQSAVDNAVVVASPAPESQAAAHGVQLGDVILGVGRHLNLQGMFHKTMHYLAMSSRPVKVLVGRPRSRQAYMDYYGSETWPPGVAPPEDSGIGAPTQDEPSPRASPPPLPEADAASPSTDRRRSRSVSEAEAACPPGPPRPAPPPPRVSQWKPPPPRSPSPSARALEQPGAADAAVAAAPPGTPAEVFADDHPSPSEQADWCKTPPARAPPRVRQEELKVPSEEEGEEEDTPSFSLRASDMLAGAAGLQESIAALPDTLKASAGSARRPFGAGDLAGALQGLKKSTERPKDSALPLPRGARPPSIRSGLAARLEHMRKVISVDCSDEDDDDFDEDFDVGPTIVRNYSSAGKGVHV